MPVRTRVSLRALKESSGVLEDSRVVITVLDLACRRYIFLRPVQVELTGFTAEEIDSIAAVEVVEHVPPGGTSATV